MDMQHMPLLLEILDLDGDLVRHFCPQLTHDLLAHQFGGKKTAAAIGDLVFGKEVLAFRQVFGHQLFQHLQILPMLSGNRYDLGIRQLLRQPLEVRQEFGLVLDAVGLVHRHDERTFHVFHAVEHQLVFIGPACAVDHEDHHIDVLEGRRGGTVHVAVERGFAIAVQARRVDVDRLDGTLGLDAEHVVAGGLRLARSDRELLAEDVVEQRRLADIGATDDGDIATAAHAFFRGRCVIHGHSPRPGRSRPRRRLPVRQCAGWRPARVSCR